MTNQAPPTSHLIVRRPHPRDLAAVPTLPRGYLPRRDAGEPDLPGLMETLNAACDEPWTIEGVLGGMSRAAGVDAVFVVAFRGRPLAITASQHQPAQFPGAGVLHGFGTHPVHRGRGLGPPWSPTPCTTSRRWATATPF